MNKIAIVTGANQGLGFALVKGLANRLDPEDVIYLTARNTERGQQAIDRFKSTRARVQFEQLDVTDTHSINRFIRQMSARHDGIDYVLSNAAARIVKERPQAEQVREFVTTNNHGSANLLLQLMPLLNSGAHYLMVASSFGRLQNLPVNLHPMFDTERLSLDDIESTMDSYVTLLESGEAAAMGWPEWINIPSKIGQVATARIAARVLREQRPNDNISINAVCPGLIDTEASRPWFDDMSEAQSPDEAASAVLDLLLEPKRFNSPTGELLQFGKVIPWLD